MVPLLRPAVVSPILLFHVRTSAVIAIVTGPIVARLRLTMMLLLHSTPIALVRRMVEPRCMVVVTRWRSLAAIPFRSTANTAIIAVSVPIRCASVATRPQIITIDTAAPLLLPIIPFAVVELSRTMMMSLPFLRMQRCRIIFTVRRCLAEWWPSRVIITIIGIDGVVLFILLR